MPNKGKATRSKEVIWEVMLKGGVPQSKGGHGGKEERAPGNSAGVK